MSDDKVAREPLKTWSFSDAPEEYKLLSDNGGDEDWITLVPRSWGEGDGYWIPWLEDYCGQYGACRTNKYEVAEGWIYIGCHS